MKTIQAVPSVDRLQLESTLRLRSQVARFGQLRPEVPIPVQIALPVAPLARCEAIDAPEVCDHAGTGREPQARLFGGGFDVVCTRCGGVL